MDLHIVSRIINGLEAEGWGAKKTLSFLMWLGTEDEQYLINRDKTDKEGD